MSDANTEIEDLRQRLAEAEQTIKALVSGEVDTVAVDPNAPMLLRSAQAALRKSEQRFRAIFEGSLDGMLLFDGAQRYVDSNAMACSILGITRERLMQNSIRHFTHGRPNAKTMLEALRHGRQHEGEAEVVADDGKTVAIEFRVGPILPDLHLATFRDVTERNRLREQLLVSDRMVSMGTLAAGVAHEINNPLAYLMANLDLALRELRLAANPTSFFDRLPEMLEILTDARSGSERVRLIVRDLKTFTRVDDQRSTPVDVRRVLEASINMAWNEIRHRARLVKNYSDMPPVDGGEARIGQVFLNLIMNAAHAIPEGAADKNIITIRTHFDGKAVFVEVHDTGSGISKENLEHIFEPFFTTKPIGVGTGLGLSICRNIMASIGGDIAVESELGKGSIFRISLRPAVLSTKQHVALERPASRPGRRGCILIVDDEEHVARSLKRTLSAEHDVTVETRAGAALQRVKNGEHFDLIFCDLMMPEMTGMDLHAELLRSLPDVANRLVFLTGGAFTTRAREYLANVDNQRFDKPFDIDQLMLFVRDQVKHAPRI